LLAPIYDDLAETPEGGRLREDAPKLRRWWDDIRTWPTVAKFRPPLGQPDRMAGASDRAFLDRPLARGLALLVFVGCVALLAWLERARWFSPEAADVDDPVQACIAERAAQIDGMLAEGVIEAPQAELFKSRAAAMCEAEAGGSGTRAPALPRQ